MLYPSAAVEYVDWKTGDGDVVSDVCFDPPGDGVGFLGRGSEPLGNGITQVLQDFPVSIGKKPVCEAQVRILLPVDLVDVLPGSGSKLRCDLVAGIGSFQSRCFCAYRHQPQ